MMLIAVLIWLICIWIGYRWAKAAYRVPDTSIGGDILALFIGGILGTILAFVVMVVLSHL